MANRIAAADGNFTAAATWGAVDATSLLDNQTGNFTIATAATWSQGQNFTPGIITIDGIAVKVATRAAVPSGTMSVRLYNVTGAAAVAGTTVTINVSDLPDDVGAANSTYEGCSVGWTFFKFAAPVALAAATNYRVEAQSSAATQVNLFRDGTANNMSRMLRTTTTGAPGAGDSLFIMGEWTAAATKTNRTVTMDETAATDYGSASTTLATFGISLGGTLTYGTTAATNYVLRISGILAVWLGGVLNIGTTGTPIPANGTAVLEFDCAVTADFGLMVYGTANVQGSPRTAGKLKAYTLLTADASGGATTLTVGDDTGWLNGDEIVISSTTRTNTESEIVALTAGAGASSLTVGATAAAHGGNATTGVQAEIILLNRNIEIRSTLSTAGAWCITQLSSTVDFDWLRFRYMYGTGSTKTGFEVRNTSGSVGLDYAIFRDSNTNGRFITFGATQTIALTWSEVHFYSTSNITSVIQGNSGAVLRFTLTGSVSILDFNGGGAQHTFQSTIAFAYTNVYISGGSGNGFVLNSVAANTPCSWTGGGIHSMTGSGFYFNIQAANWTFTNFNVWRTNAGGGGEGGVSIFSLISDCTWINCKFFGNVSHFGLATGGGIRLRWVNCLFAGDTTFATARAFNIYTNAVTLEARFENCTFGVVTSIYAAHTSADFGSAAANAAEFYELTFVNCTLASATEFEAALTNAALGYSFIARQRKDGTTATHEKVYTAVGTIAYETTTFRTAAPSEKLTPISASLKLPSSRKRVAIAAGQAATLSAYVRKDGSYTGSAPRLILLANPALGLDNDTVLDTMTGGSGAWEQLTGSSSPVAEEDGVFECYVDCDGSAGNVFVDDWSATVT